MRALEQRLQITLPMARLEVHELPGCAPLKLALLNRDFPTGPLAPEVMRDVIARPAYWAFCWGSGLGLAQTILAEPERVRGKQVLDLGSGSGVAGIAAAMAGAAHVTACDTDPDALLASAVNAELNGITLELAEDVASVQVQPDLVLMADVLYDRANLPLLDAALGLGGTVTVADSRIRDLEDDRFVETGALEARTLPNLGEFDEFRVVRLFESRS